MYSTLLFSRQHVSLASAKIKIHYFNYSSAYLVSIYCPFISSLPLCLAVPRVSDPDQFAADIRMLIIWPSGSDFRAGSWIDSWFYPKYPCFVYIAVFSELHLSQCLFQKSVARFPHLLTVTWPGSNWRTGISSRAGSRASLLSRLILRGSRPST